MCSKGGRFCPRTLLLSNRMRSAFAATDMTVLPILLELDLGDAGTLSRRALRENLWCPARQGWLVRRPTAPAAAPRMLQPRRAPFRNPLWLDQCGSTYMPPSRFCASHSGFQMQPARVKCEPPGQCIPLYVHNGSLGR